MQMEINAWLNGDRDYTAGVELFRISGGSSFLVNLLAIGPDAYNTPKLLTELTRLSEADSPDQSAPLQDQSQALPAPPANESYTPDNNLEKKLRIDLLLKNIWKEMCHLHGQLSILPEGRRLFECAKLILTKNLKRQDLWDQLHYFEKNNVWFDDLPENQPKPFDLEQEIKNLMASRSKCKARLKKPLPDAKKQHELKKVADFDQKIKDLKSKRR